MRIAARYWVRVGMWTISYRFVEGGYQKNLGGRPLNDWIIQTRLVHVAIIIKRSGLLRNFGNSYLGRLSEPGVRP